MQISKLSMKDGLLWLGLAVLTGAAFFGTYSFQLATPIIAIIWLAWFVGALGLAYFTQAGQAVFSFGKEAKLELEKVVWPSRQETTQTTLIVMVMVMAAGFVLWGIDSSMMWAIGRLTHLS
ncbi:MAG: preprotein translocase subunit SecE [Gammaproteobacteria bacterium]|nr:preprotein translocase subunit SecE [Gammaproteobacteria bacterium]